MRFVDEYRDAKDVSKLATQIASRVTRPWTIMEICGGQTHSIARYGLEELLPSSLELVHGPGCPVCVTATETIDRALAIADLPDVVFCSFGDMLRVPGTQTDLLTSKANGADVRIVYSPLDAVALAESLPDKQVVFFGVGFETTAPANAMALFQARDKGLDNFSMLLAQVRVPPAMEAILSSPKNRVQAFLAAGHVCSVMGTAEYLSIAEKFKAPIVVTGFEPVDILNGILMAVIQLEEGCAKVENAYSRAAQNEGNPTARTLINEVFVLGDRIWRGMGQIPGSGWFIRPDLSQFDAEKRFDVTLAPIHESPDCIAGLILQGAKKPYDCVAFGTRCTPDKPLGAPMVSSEGACAAYYRYRGADQ